MEDKTTNYYKELFKIFVISLSASVFAKLLIILLSGFATGFVAYDFDIPSFFDFNGITYLAGKSSPKWYFDAEVSILLTKPIVSMFAGLFALAGLILIKKKLISFFFLLFWLNLYAFNNSAGILIDDIIAKTGFYDVTVLFKFNNQVLIIVSFVAVYILYKIGIVNALAFRTSVGSKFNQSFKLKTLILLAAIILPWFTNFLLLSFLSPKGFNTLNLLQNGSLIILILPFFTYTSKKKILTHVEIIEETNLFDWVNTSLYMLGILLLWFSLNQGIYTFAK